MFQNLIKNEKLLCAIGGAVAVIIGKKVIGSPKTRQLAVSGLAQGMKLTHEAKEAFQNMKDEAADLCYDAKAEAGLDASETAETAEELAE